jgi:CspA family cold shock protein
VASGTVKWFNPTKGYGFIQPSSGGGKDVFVHISAVDRAGLSTLNEGQQVDYEIVSNRGKESAENLKVDARRPRNPAGFAQGRPKVAEHQPAETTKEQLTWQFEVNHCPALPKLSFASIQPRGRRPS